MAVLRAYRRFAVVLWQFLPLIVAYLRDRRKYLLFGGRRRVSSEMRVRRAQRLLDSLLTLGPTFIKLGQLLSTRPDILPPEYVDVLEGLQDQVPPADWEAAREVLEADVGDVNEAFDEFDADAISGASLGQVYTAEIDGDPVAVKVRRPGIEALVEADLRVIRWALPLVERFVGQARAFSLDNLADEFAKTIREEMDYGREAEMLAEIRGNFAENDRIAIPRVYDDYSTERVLTMAYVPGTKISNVEELDRRGVDRHAVAETLERAYLQMIIEDGVFHADPHPGNLAVQDDGTIVFYDFGMSGRADEFVQRKIVDFYIAVANQDIEAILDTLIELGTLSPDADRATMAEVMELAIRDARGESIETYRVQQIVGKVEDTIYDFPLRLPANLALVLRVATVVEGVCVTLDPDFDFVSVATDYLGETGYREEGARQFVEETGEEFARAAQSAVRVPPKLERALDRIDRDDLYVRADIEDSNDVIDRLGKRIVLGLLLAVSVLSTSYLYADAHLRAAAVTAGLAAVSAFYLYRSFRKRKRLQATPQFTRQNLRERRNK
ncbi:ABC1 kinase family protein [Salarchaeum japonicum]|uniref:AarF/ABC1/UbiB kinase family protein n=1 Tax=Salarchaeum japonicum TaxID=555573 RepID=A0AAV3SYN3_9EURY|nr:AarF/ABC1/UbiB kinase family protein [Salarchaeum japonicum]